jgi:hypothetical protein
MINRYKLRTNIEKLEEIRFSIRTSNVLKNASITTLEQLISLSKYDIKRLYGAGKRTVDEINSELNKVGLSLKKHKKSIKSKNPIKAVKSGFTLHLVSILFLIFILPACSVKKDEEQAPQNNTRIVQPIEPTDDVGNPIVEINDKDRDGISDEVEMQLGRDHLTGHFPSFVVSDFNRTNVTIIDFDDRKNDKVFSYVLQDTFDRSLLYRPIKEKIANFAYQRIIGKATQPSPISPDDIGIIKLSKFSRNTSIDMKLHIHKMEETLAPESVTISSIFKLNATNFVGIKKISKIRVEYGFIDTDGGFESFGYTSDLLNTSGTRVIFNSRGNLEQTSSSAEIHVRIDRVDLDLARRITEENLDIAMKITDYEAEIVDGNKFNYSEQIAEAFSSNTLFALSRPREDKLIFNSRLEPLHQTIRREMGEIVTDLGGKISKIGPYDTTTDFPIVFEDGDNDHMKGASWFLFTASSTLKDIPNIGEINMLGYLRNDEIAKAGKRKIEETSKKIINENETVINFRNVSLGETIYLKFSGNKKIPVKHPIEKTHNEASWSMPAGTQKAPDFITVKKGVNFNYRPYSERNEPIEIYNNEIQSFTEDSFDLVFTSENYPNGISWGDRELTKQDPPVYDEIEKIWIFEIVVNDDFVQRYGNTLSAVFPIQGIEPFRHGVMDDFSFKDGFLGFTNPKFDVFHSNGKVRRNIHLEIKRAFK